MKKPILKKMKQIVKRILLRNENYWISDSKNKFKINTAEVKKYFDTVKETPLSKMGEKIEEKIILDLLEI